MSPSSTDAGAVLDADAAIQHLRRRGVIQPRTPASAVPLTGGVSGTVWRVSGSGWSVVVKQALPQLRVSSTWVADPRRTVTEGRALRLAAGIDAHRVPSVIDLDDEANILVLAAAPATVTTWKEALLAMSVDREIAMRVGIFLAKLHRGTALGAGEAAGRLSDFEQDQAFAELRVQPYFETVAARRPELSRAVMAPVREMRKRRRCLVHGDVSPKNVLCDSGLLWLVDWEVAHLGDPAFDLAFMATHLLLKSIHRPSAAADLRAAALAFLAAYATAGGLAEDDAHLCALTGALITARVDGASPVEYLDGNARAAARTLGERLMQRPETSLSAVVTTGVTLAHD